MKCVPGLTVRRFSGYSNREIDICRSANFTYEVIFARSRTPGAEQLSADGKRR